MRTPIIAGNWKMYKTVADTVKYVKEFRVMVKDMTNVEMVVAPPFTAVHAVAEALRNANVGVAAQDLYWEREGAFTGEVSAQMIKEAGAEYVIIGHSERRRLFNETDATVNRKLVAALGAGLTAIVCVGETKDERVAGKTLDVVHVQTQTSLPDGATPENLVVAYEPVWAIGTGLTPTPADVAAVHGFVRRHLETRYGGAGAQIRILYGGSVKPSNARELLHVPNVDGALVGGASLKADDFLGIAKAYL